jgi:hypothetical protein
MRPALKERQRIASACPRYLTVVVEYWAEPRCSESFAAKISFGPIPQLLQSWVFLCTDPGFRSAPPWAEFLLRLRRVKIPWRHAHQDLQISQRRRTLNRCQPTDLRLEISQALWLLKFPGNSGSVGVASNSPISTPALLGRTGRIWFGRLGLACLRGVRRFRRIVKLRNERRKQSFACSGENRNGNQRVNTGWQAVVRPWICGLVVRTIGEI